MIKLFRNIRKKLIEQDNVRRYFFYAVGESIIIVTIQKYNLNLKATTYRSLPKCRDREGLGVGHTHDEKNNTVQSRP